MKTQVFSILHETRDHLGLTAAPSEETRLCPLRGGPPQLPAGVAAVGQGPCSPWRPPGFSWGSYSLQQDGELPRSMQDAPHVPGRRGGDGSIHICFPKHPGPGRTGPPPETEALTKESSEPNTWGAPTRRAFGSLGGHGALSVCLQKQCPGLQLSAPGALHWPWIPGLTSGGSESLHPRGHPESWTEGRCPWCFCGALRGRAIPSSPGHGHGHCARGPVP